MIDISVKMPGKTDDSSSLDTVHSFGEINNSSSVWNKVVKTIKNSNIDVDKLIKDSIDYGLGLGLFQQSKCGKVVAPDASNDELPNKHINEKCTPNNKTKSGSRSCSSTAVPSTDKRRKSATDNNFSQSPYISSNLKRRRHDSKINNTHDIKKVQSKLKCLRRDMVRPVPVCAYCLGDEELNNRTKEQEDMIACWDCGTCSHPSCLQWPISLLEKVRNIRWQCLQCKCCSYCGNVSKKDDDMLLCDSCDQGFHMYCFDPPMKALPKGEWICRLCRPPTHNKENITSFSMSDFNFYPSCQIITRENVKKLCLTPKRYSNISPIKQRKVERSLIKGRPKIGKVGLKMSLLHMKKKKLLDMAVMRQKSALTDGLTSFFTPGNKRQSRVSKQSVTPVSLNKSKLSETSSSKERKSFSSLASMKSPINSNKKERMKANISMVESESCSVEVGNQSRNSRSKESTPTIVPVIAKKRGRKSKITILEAETKPESVTEMSVTESSSMTMSRIEQSTSQSVMSTENTETDQYPISDLDRKWYSEIQEQVAQLLPPPMDAPPPQLQSLSKKSRQRSEHSEPPELFKENINHNDSICEYPTAAGDCVTAANKRFPPRIQIGKYIIDTWYSAPYPSEYARLNVLYICEYCLKHIKSYDIYTMHMEKCSQYFPPGNEIYRNGDLSVFEVDGYVSKLYCQQLCLLAKLFLDHKTLYYDVEPFLFYVAVIAKNQSCHIIGYFSKEKRSTHKYNLSCIMVLPPYQKYNYGRFLIDFSYLLSRVEEQSGSPEKPLSTLGRLSYESYWKSKIIPFLVNEDNVTGEFYRQLRLNKPKEGLSITIDKISTETGINPHDVASTIQLLSKSVDLDDSDRITIQLDWDKIQSESEKYSNRYLNWVPLDPDYLRWAPLMQPNERIPNYINEPSNESVKVSYTSLNQSATEEENPIPKPIKTVKAQKTIVKKTGQILKSSESKSLTPTITTTEVNDPQTINVEKRTKTSCIIKSPSKVKLFRRKLHKAERPVPVLRHKSFRLFAKKKLQMTSQNDTDKALTKEISIDINKIPDMFIHQSETKSTISPVEPDPVMVDSQICDRNSKKIVAVSPIVAVEMIKKRGRKPKQQINIESDSLKKAAISSPIIESEAINVDLTRSDNSDNEENDDCVVIPALGSTREFDWRNNKPVLEMFKETMFHSKSSDTESSCKPSPPINTDEPSPVSATQNTIQGPLLEEDSETDLILTSNRQPLIILEKCDLEQTRASVSRIDLIDLSQDMENVASNLYPPFRDLCSRELNIIVSGSTSNGDSSPQLVELEEITETDSIKQLTRLLSEDSKEDSTNSLQLPSEISLNDEFHRFYNGGNVFNCITTSHTDQSSDKDANESLLSVSNSDLDVIGSYSCDSSLVSNCVTKPVRCSPAQSDLTQNHVSSTTVNFVTPNPDWNSPIKHLETLCVLVNPITPIVTLSDFNDVRRRESKIEEGEFVKNGEFEAPNRVERIVVSSSLDNLMEEEIELSDSLVSSMDSVSSNDNTSSKTA